MYCIKCGSELVEDAMFCKTCGTATLSLTDQLSTKSGWTSIERGAVRLGCATYCFLLVLGVFIVFSTFFLSIAFGNVFLYENFWVFIFFGAGLGCVVAGYTTSRYWASIRRRDESASDSSIYPTLEAFSASKERREFHRLYFERRIDFAQLFSSIAALGGFSFALVNGAGDAYRLPLTGASCLGLIYCNWRLYKVLSKRIGITRPSTETIQVTALSPEKLTRELFEEHKETEKLPLSVQVSGSVSDGIVEPTNRLESHVEEVAPREKGLTPVTEQTTQQLKWYERDKTQDQSVTEGTTERLNPKQEKSQESD